MVPAPPGHRHHLPVEVFAALLGGTLDGQVRSGAQVGLRVDGHRWNLLSQDSPGLMPAPSSRLSSSCHPRDLAATDRSYRSRPEVSFFGPEVSPSRPAVSSLGPGVSSPRG